MNIESLNTLEYNKIIETISTFSLTDSARDRILEIKPSTDHSRIYSLMNETSEAREILKNSTSVPLLGIKQIPLLIEKLKKEMILQPDELEKIKHVLVNTKKFKAFMSTYEFIAPTISQYVYSMYELNDIKEEIERCIYNGHVDDKASTYLSKIRKQIYIVEGRIKSKLDSLVKSPKIKKYLQDTSLTIKNNRYVLQVKAAYKHEVSGVTIEKSSTGSTLFIEPTAVNRMQEELNQLRIDEENEIYQILSYLSSLILESEKEISITIDTFISYDVIFAKAKYSKSIDGNPVTLNTNHITKIINGRHPLLGKDAVPLNFEIGSDYQSLVITGPNTGGKTVALKTVGLFTLMAQSGFHVPCDEKSQFAIYGDILVDIGDGQSIEQSLSTFSSHITNIIDIVHLANKYTMVILDEIGSGTDPTEGEGLAIAILEALHQQGATIVATSHYGKVKEYAAKADGFINGKMHFDVETLKPTYQLTIGEAGESNAFIIALRLGLNPEILTRAHDVTYEEIKDYSTVDIKNKRTIETHQYKGKRAKKPKKIDSDLLRQALTQDQSNITSSDNQNVLKPSDGSHSDSSIRRSMSELPHIFEVGDKVHIQTLHSDGIVFEPENHKQEIGIMINRKKIYIHKRKIKLLISAKDLYPEGYDFDIIFKSKDYRKADKLFNRKFVKNYSVEVDEKDL